MIWFYFILYLLENAKCEYFDSYSGHVITEEQMKKYEMAGNVQYCTNNIKLPCDPNEWRRLDGTCNNLKNPSYGAVHTPIIRLLKPVFGKGLTDRKSEKGKELPLVRTLRTKILKEGKGSDPIFTQLMTYFIVWMFTDIGSIKDTLNYITETTYCCEPRGRGDYACTPHRIPRDDPVHRFSHVRCMNQTRPITFQTHGCLQNGTTTPARFNTETSIYDMSTIYYYQGKPADRTYKGGELEVEEINGKIWPARNTSKNNICLLNQGPEENLCFKSTTNGILGPKFIAVLLIRLHNYIAKQLAAINPCWDDKLLFFTAREINIAIQMQIYLHELMAGLLGKKNLIKEGVLSCSSGFRDLYDENVLPQVSEEYLICLRYFHTVQESKIKMYDNKGYFTKTYDITNLTMKTGYFLRDNNYEQLLQSSFRQPCGKFDHTVDPDISEVGLGPLQYSSDITMNDLAKSRTIGFQGYVKYREYCSCKKYRTFEDLLDVMDSDRVDTLKNSYHSLGDVDLMAGIWSERKVPGGHVPYTVYCLFVEQLKRMIKSDRFWYERRDKPHALKLDQLQEIRKITIAGVFCMVGDSITEIQKSAFKRIGPKNPLVNCKDIPKIDFRKWKDYYYSFNNNSCE